MSTMSPLPVRRLPLPCALALIALPCLVVARDAGVAGSVSGCDSIAAIPITWDIDYEKDIQSIFNQRCANCHVDHAGLYSGDLDLDPGVSWDNMVGWPSNGDASVLRVDPGNPLASALFRKVNCEQPGFGVRMPQNRPPIPLAEQALIFDWIAAGAPNGKTDTIFHHGFDARP